MSAVPRRCGTASPAILLLFAAACSTLQTGFPSESDSRDSDTFLARQYLQRGRAAWAMGNAANARFLLGRAVELDPLSGETIAAWSAHWPVDSLPAEAAAARTTALAAQAPRDAAAPAPAEAEVADAAGIEPATVGADTGGSRTPEGTLAGEAAGGPADAAPVDSAADPVDDLAAAMGAVTGGPADRAPERGPAAPPAEVARLRAEFENARASRDPAALRRSGEELMRAAPHHLPTLYRVLSTWVGARVDPDAVAARVRDLLARLEFGDTAFLEGKGEDVTDAAWLRVHRGRLLDVLGWSAFLRGNLVEAEAALRSAETEINLRGHGDVTHLRHLAALYEARGDLRRAETYAIAAAARDESRSGETRAAAARLWTRRHGSAGFDARLASEAERVRREERSAAVADRLYAPLPTLSARRSDGAALTGATVRGRVTVLVLWEPGCGDCVRLLRDLSARRPGGSAASAARGRAPLEIVALRVDWPGTQGASGGAAADPRGLPGLVFAEGDDTAPFARALDARRLPVTLVIEPEGFVQYRHAGYPIETTERERWLERLGWQVESLAGLRPRGAARDGGAR